METKEYWTDQMYIRLLLSALNTGMISFLPQIILVKRLSSQSLKNWNLSLHYPRKISDITATHVPSISEMESPILLAYTIKTLIHVAWLTIYRGTSNVGDVRITVAPPNFTFTIRYYYVLREDKKKTNKSTNGYE